MPKEPPTTGWIGERSIVRMVAEKVAVAMTIGSASRRSRKGLREINLHKVPTGTKGASGSVRDKEQAIRGQRDGGGESSASKRRRRERKVVRREKRDSGSSRNPSSRESERERKRSGGSGSVKVRDVAKLKQRQMVGRQSRRKPHVVAHLDAKRGFKRVD